MAYSVDLLDLSHGIIIRRSPVRIRDAPPGIQRAPTQVGALYVCASELCTQVASLTTRHQRWHGALLLHPVTTRPPPRAILRSDQISLRRLIRRAKKKLFHWSPELAARCGIDFRLKAPNRSFLEQQIFDYLNQQAARSGTPMQCLFVGMHEYTWHYPRLLKMDFHSLDMDPEQAAYGSAGKHTIGSATNMSAHYAEASFDVVVANGVIGWGLNERPDFERLLEQCHRVLKPGALLILGYNDTPERAPFNVDIGWGDLFAPMVPTIPGVTQARHAMNDSYAHVFLFGERHEPAAAT